MPATESTWRNQTLLNQIFAISGVVLTVVTVWMFYKDHSRPWKQVQPNVVNIDEKYNLWRQEQFETTDALLEHERLMSAWQQAAAQPLPADLFSQFKERVQQDAEFRQTTVSLQSHDDAFARLSTLAEAAVQKRAAATEAVKASEAQPEDAPLAKAATAADKAAYAAETAAHQQRDALLSDLRAIVDAAKTREEKALGIRKFKSARLDAAKANLDIAIRDNLDQEIINRQKIVDELTSGKGGLNDLTLQYQRLSDFRKDIDTLVKQMTLEADAAKKSLDDGQAELNRLKTAYADKRETWVNFSETFPYLPSPGKKILNLPILDAFGTRRKIDNLWSQDLEQNYNFSKVRRFDRCTTCHQSMAKTIPGDPTSPLFVTRREIELVLVPPPAEELPPAEKNADGATKPQTLEDVLGIRLADEGVLSRDDVTVKYVRAKSAGAKAQLVGEPKPSEMLAHDIRLKVATTVSPPPISERAFPVLPGLMLGDVIAKINGDELFGAGRVSSTLLALVKQGQPIRLTITRGLPHPYASHPRLDLFVSDSSPHKLGTFGCTICHEGQGSATDFKWASHTPNDPMEAQRWASDYGWFDNHHWIYPMNPQRFVESSCLKCHHEVVELEPSERFPDAPAPKLVHGYQLIRKYGCFGCHEINGFDGPVKRVGPDLRLEPNYFAAGEILAGQFSAREKSLRDALAPLQEKSAPERKAIADRAQARIQLETDLATLQASTAADKDQQIEALNARLEAAKTAETAAAEAFAPAQKELSGLEGQLTRIAELKGFAQQLTAHPELDDLRRKLRTALEEDAQQAAEPAGSLLSAESHQIANLLKDVEAPGSLRKPGPSLRHVGSKLDRIFLYDWINNPRNFRPDTRMPRFFGQWDHFPKDEQGQPHDHRAEQFEPIEVRGMMEYLLSQTTSFDFEKKPAGVDEWSAEEQVTRGRMQFETRGCLACHTHKDFPDTAKFRNPKEIVQGPDLSGVGTKFSATDGNKNGPEWLYSWIKNPTKYHPRTVMPNLFLEVETDSAGKKFDPAADIVAYFLAESTVEWKPVAESGKPLDAAGKTALDELLREYLNEAFYTDAAEKYLVEGIPPALRNELKGAEQDLIVELGQKLTDEQRLRYIGRKTISKYGCFGCHDIPGFEDAKPIGTGLADWGRKDPSKLAFEHITHYLEHHGHAAGAHGGGSLTKTGDAQAERGTSEQPHSEATTSASLEGEHAVGDARSDVERAQDEEYYHHAIESGSRIGFINQKLAKPRSFDYEKIANKRYNERLRMPQFPFTAADREAVVTFVLGLVAEPPREKYLFQPSPRSKALIAGRQVLDKYNCAGCHILETEKWKISFAPGDYGPQQQASMFPFLKTHFGAKELQAAATPDRRNQLHATLQGLPAVMKNDGLPYVADEDGVAIEGEEPYDPAKVSYALDLFQPTILDGLPYLTGQSTVPVPVGRLHLKYPTKGGMLTKYLLPRVTELERAVNSNASGSEALGWLPPPLVGEGSKVQAAWLHDFLLEPYPIRPAVFLRMPKFNMSSQEASALVNYFAALDNANYPYEFTPARQDARQEELAAGYEKKLTELGVEAQSNSRFDDAMKMVVDNNYCVKCHKVGDFEPQGSARAKAPNLADVYRRLRPDYLRNWIANPKMILPYTSMPVNIPYDANAPFEGGVKQDLYHGTSTEQVDALVDLLMNFDRYTKQHTQISDLVKPAAVPPGASPAAP